MEGCDDVTHSSPHNDALMTSLWPQLHLMCSIMMIIYQRCGTGKYAHNFITVFSHYHILVKLANVLKYKTKFALIRFSLKVIIHVEYFRNVEFKRLKTRR